MRHETADMKWAPRALMMGLMVFTLIFVACAQAKQRGNARDEASASRFGMKM